MVSTLDSKRERIQDLGIGVTRVMRIQTPGVIKPGYLLVSGEGFGGKERKRPDSRIPKIKNKKTGKRVHKRQALIIGKQVNEKNDRRRVQ